MSRDLNSCVFTGRLGKDVESRTASSGTTIALFSLACSGWNGSEEVTTWINVKCFGKTADLATQYLSKGSRVCIQARYQLNQWETQDGEKRSSPEFICNDIVFLDSKPKDGTQGQQQTRQPERSGGGAEEDVPF